LALDLDLALDLALGLSFLPEYKAATISAFFNPDLPQLLSEGSVLCFF